MTVPTDKITNRVVDLQASVRALESMSEEDRVKAAMMLASFFMEYAAFEMAGSRSACEVSEMMIMAAKLEQAADKIPTTQPDKGDGISLRKS